MAVYCALAAPGFEEGVVLAVNQGGDSDSTGALAGHLLGTLHGAGSIPQRWLESLELRGVIQEMAEDLFRFPAWDLKACPELAKKYPGF
jgi:ADP-ribosylglycohydrolase